MPCGCCGQAGVNIRTCGSKHRCQNWTNGLRCHRLDAIHEKEVELTKLRERRERDHVYSMFVADTLSSNFYADEEGDADYVDAGFASADEDAEEYENDQGWDGNAEIASLFVEEEDLTDLLEIRKCIRLTARNCLNLDTIPGKYPLNAIHDAALSQARKLMPSRGQLYVGLSQRPRHRLQQHTLFSHMIIIGKTIDAGTAISVEKFLIRHLSVTKDLLNSSKGGEGVDQYAPYTYVYLGYGPGRNLRP